MLEIMLAGGKTGKYFPKSGPGSKSLQVGDKTYGYFGTVTEAEMGVNDEFKRLLDTTNASVRTVGVMTNVWFKFVINERFLFFPKLPLAGKMLIKDLYAIKAVFDTKETYRPTTDYTTGLPLYAQTLHITNGVDMFMVRLMDSLPGGFQGTSTTGNLDLVNGEVWKLIAALSKVAPSNNTLGIKQYDQGSFATLYDGVTYYGQFVKEFYGATLPTTGNFLHSVANDGRTVYAGATYEAAWRPVLEYIPDDERAGMVFELDRFSVGNEGLPNSSSPSGTVVQEMWSLTNFNSVTESFPLSLTTDLSSSAYEITSINASTTIDNSVPVFYAEPSFEFSLSEITGLPVSDYYGYLTL